MSGQTAGPPRARARSAVTSTSAPDASVVEARREQNCLTPVQTLDKTAHDLPALCVGRLDRIEPHAAGKFTACGQASARCSSCQMVARLSSDPALPLRSLRSAIINAIQALIP